MEYVWPHFCKKQVAKITHTIKTENEIAEDFYFQLDTSLKWPNFYHEYMLLL